MNIFNFSIESYTSGLFMAFIYGVFLGFYIGLARFLLFTAFERKEA